MSGKISSVNESTTFKRAIFCDELRGFSCLLVVFAHLIIGFNLLHGFLYNPVIGQVYPKWLLSILPKYFDGALGVALFFMISGFVIPFSLYSKGPVGFIRARIIRIYPTLVVSLFLVTLLLVLVGELPFNVHALLIWLNNLSLFRGWFGGESLNSVLWTLEVEIRFYLYAALFFGVLKRSPVIFILIPLLITAVILIFGFQPVYPTGLFHNVPSALGVVCYDFGFICYMNLGVLLYLRYVNKISVIKARLLGLASIFVVIYFLHARYIGNPLVISIFAATIFVCFAKYRTSLGGIFSGLFARISYPLYLIHAPVGYVLLSILIFKCKIYSLIALPLVTLVLIGISILIHDYIEYPTVRLSRLFGPSPEHPFRQLK